MQSSLKWYAVALAGALAVAGCSHGSSTSSSSTQTAASPAASAAAGAMTAASPGGAMVAAAGNAAAGKTVYDTNCSSCHQANGEGSPGAFPPLAGNSTVTGLPGTVIHIVKYGLTGPVTVAGKTYNGMMPAWGTQLSNVQIADAVTYIRTSWGNKAKPVTTAEVAAVTK
jgi:mono/diheme cytochrome c family protein